MCSIASPDRESINSTTQPLSECLCVNIEVSGVLFWCDERLGKSTTTRRCKNSKRAGVGIVSVKERGVSMTC